MSVHSSSAVSLVGIYEISKILTSSLDLRTTLREVLKVLSSYLQMRRGVVLLRQDDGELLLLSAAKPSPVAAEAGTGDVPMAALERILTSEMPFVARHAAEDPFVGERGYADIPGEQRVAFIGVPIRTGGRPFGVLAVLRVWTPGESVSFESDVRLLVMVANLIAQSVRLQQSVSSDRRLLMADSHRRQKTLARPAEPRSLRRIDGIIGDSRPMQDVFGQVHQVAPTRSTVLLRGESGTGKELVARAIHEHSPRRAGPFVKVNCTALPETLLESELFGHDKGAFTGATQERRGRFELAHTGTIFLDEIGDISRAFQAKLLRVLQEREFERVGGNRTVKVDVRVVAATNRNLEEAVAKGEFRGDLYYRINVVPIFIPPLRDRREDIPLLAETFLRRFNEENGRNLRFADPAVRVLTGCEFPGNVRELENCINRVATMTTGDLIVDFDLPCQTDRCLSRALGSYGWHAAPAGIDGPSDTDVADVPQRALPPARAADRIADAGPDDPALPKRERLVRAMQKAGWVQAKAARLLGMTPRQVGYALRKYNIEIKKL